MYAERWNEGELLSSPAAFLPPSTPTSLSSQWQVHVSWLQPHNFREGWMAEFCSPTPTHLPPSCALYILQPWPFPALHNWMSKAAAATYLALWLTAVLLSEPRCICAVFIASFTFAVIESLPHAKYAPSDGLMRAWKGSVRGLCVCVCVWELTDRLHNSIQQFWGNMMAVFLCVVHCVWAAQISLWLSDKHC